VVSKLRPVHITLPVYIIIDILHETDSWILLKERILLHC
jgi:hypothetical protein